MAGVLAAISGLISVRPLAVRRTLRHEPRGSDGDLEAMLLGPYVTPLEHHDYLADRWSVIADVAVVVGLEQSVRRVQSGSRDDLA
jgi:hypothetical protein